MKGFITIATGAEHYYKIAANLLLSYRYFSKEPLPFAIIAEEENEYTALFDDVILTTEAKRSFLDKFLLLKLCPYDETIFIDADSLAIGDLNKWWQAFDGATDFSSIGVNCSIDDSRNAWYNIEDVGEYGKQIAYKCRVHAGVCYIRKTPKIDKLYQDCMELHNNFDKLYFHTCPTSEDECIFGLSMPMNGMKTIHEDSDYLVVYPFLKKVRIDLAKGILIATTNWGSHTENGTLIHFGTYYTHQELYRFNVEYLQLLIKYNGDLKKLTFGEKILFKYKFRYFFLSVGCWFNRQYKIWKRRISKLLKK